MPLSVYENEHALRIIITLYPISRTHFYGLCSAFVSLDRFAICNTKAILVQKAITSSSTTLRNAHLFHIAVKQLMLKKETCINSFYSASLY